MMGIRSLLLAAFVISNVSWTTSRHHFRHHGNIHGSRHRRQDAGLYHPASYVIPGGLGTGPWGEWGKVSPCSRTCGGGVANQKRICLQVGPDDEPTCTGGDTKYFSCQTQDCPETAGDFRSEQCSEFDHQPYRGSGIRYTWVPYTKAPNPCELNCMPRGERFYYKQRAQVVDGTRCNDESFDVCVAGVCQPAGCDMMLGSVAREDKCRNCRGNGTNCHTIEGLLDGDDLTKGYNDMLLIPQGATNIFIEEVRPSNNYLALRGKDNGEYYLNGKYEIVSPNSFVIAGTLWHYERSSQGLAAPDKLKCMGPTSEPLYLSLILQDYNVGIKYEYSVPSALALPLNEQYNWVHNSFSECSASCGGGFQVREVTCRSRGDLNIVDEKLCGDEFKPPTNQTCNIEDCPPRWVEGPWSPCSRPCGEGGTRSRQVFCEKTITNRETFRFSSIVADDECYALLGPKPELYQTCNQNATCPTWFTGPWKPCDRLCGEGKETRLVVCHQKINGFVQLFEDRECEGEKPITEKPCLLHPCDGVDWVISEWSGCDTCLSTVRTRVAHCATKDHKVIDSNLCSYHPSPVLVEQCDRTKLPSCQVQWYATQWSNCSVECGTGVRTRRVFCGLFDGASVIKVDDERCDKEYKYNDTTECVVPKEKCAAKWFAGPWSECSKKCGGGEQNRRVMCLFSTDDLKCDDETILHSTQSCNTGPCDKDDLLPLDSKSSPVLDDYDEEDCVEEDEEYPEVGAEAFTSTSLTRFPDFILDDDTTSTTDITKETGSGFEWLESSSTSTTDGTDTTDTYSTDVESTTEPDSTTKKQITQFPDFEYENDTTSTTDLSEETGSGLDWYESSSISTTDGTETTETTDTYSTDVESSTEPDVTSSTESSTTSNNEFSTTEDGSTTSESGSSTTENIDSSSIFSTESSITDSDMSSITDDGKSSTTETTVSGTTENSESTSTESIHSSTIESTLYSTQESSEFSTSESGISSTTENKLSSTTENGATITTEDISTTEGSTDSTTAESNTMLSTESSTTESDITGTGSTETTETEESSTSPGSTDSSTTESSTKLSTESSTTESDITGTSGSTETTETEERSTSPVSTDSTTTESSTMLSTESSTTESDITGTSGSTETTETEESSTSPVNTDSTTAESSTKLSTESSTTESDITGTSGSTETTEIEESSPSPGSTDSSTIESSTKLSTESSTTESDITGTSGSTETTETEESSTSPGSTFSTTAESSTTESSTIESDITSTSGSTETTETEESSTSPGSTDSTAAESSTALSTESSTTESDITVTSGSTETTETEESSPSIGTESSTIYSTESSTTESDITGTSGSTETTETAESSTSAGTTDVSTSSEEPLTSESSVTETTPWNWATTVGVITNKPRCKPRKIAKCTRSKFGCCPDKKTPATGPFDEGCPNPETCKDLKSGCCPDGVSPAAGPHGLGCPITPCNETLYGCCSDNVTAAEDNNQEGCPPPPPACKTSKYGCCDDNDTEAKGPEKQGCPETEIQKTTEKFTTAVDKGCATSEFGCCFDNETDSSGPNGEGCPCSISEFGCCPDGITTASGNKLEGCLMSCNTSAYGCCLDGETPAHGPNFEGCCLQHEFGCCPDNYRPAKGPDHEGCECQYARFGCCTDNVTIARGPNMEGCGCEHSEYGCCPDRHTEAKGLDYIGCECHTHQFGCCPDGVTIATGPELEGCRCERSKYGCCGDETTAAKGPNMKGCDCSNSKYGCCPDGETEAKGEKFLNCENVPVNRQAACALNFTQGTCTNYTALWFYDMEYGGCSQFWYGGCDGNANRFVSKAECEDVCVQPSPKDTCNLPKVKARCNGYNVRWYYNSEREQCSQFVYGGCLGNANNFDSKEICEERCEPEKTKDQCNLELERGPCAGNFVRWGFSAERRRCEQFVWGGCGGNNNRYHSEAACQLQCNPPGQPRQECSLPQDPGNCTEKHPVWSFNKIENRCVPFYYSGCGGNDNRFNSEQSCDESCPSAFVQEICTLPAMIGDCANYTIKWFFDTTKKRCRQFYYGGCGGNDNNFLTESECENRCSEQPTTTTIIAELLQPQTEPAVNLQISEFCLLDIDKGPCTQSLQHWAYDEASGTCVQFEYGGCGGNRNNFPTLEYCQRYCGAPSPPQDVCQLPFVSGPCDQSIMQWFYDTTSNSCSSFTYGGCEGNGNRFNSLADCEQKCHVQTPPTTTPPITTTIASAIILPSECQVSRELENCLDSGEVWFLDVEQRACVALRNEGPGPRCRYTGVFRSQEACERTCGAFQDPCGQSLDPGNCNSYLIMWYYDSHRDMCNQFVYGGCGGSDNRFETQAECEGRCKKEVTTTFIPITSSTTTTTLAPSPHTDLREEAECATPVSLAPCGENVTVYYFDSRTKACSVGDFGACRYSNSYRTEEECERRCGAFKQLDVCGSRLDPGPCLNAIPKFYWDPLSGSCRGFAYGGCLGGPNRFSTIDECEEICGATGPETETGNEVLPDCDSYNEECAELQCEYGIQRTRLSTGCERCICNDHPCANKQCASGERCVATPYRDDNTFDILYFSDCRLANKSGSCPSTAVSTSSIERRCRQQCYDDADCLGAGKCCERGCSKLCLEPAVATSPAPTVTTHVPEPPQEPSVNPATKPEVHASLGGTATLICLFHGNPPPKITWQRGQVMIESDVGRYRLLSDGSLEIVSLYRNDSGVYICIADNGLGIARQEVNLQVDETETGNEVLPDCDSYNVECSELQCEYGVQRTRLSTGCERCICNDHPCANKQCSSGERCVATPYRDAITHDILYSSDCRLANKSGSCPSNVVSVSSLESSCTQQCYDDADCLGVGKCCERGCSKLCLEPAVATSPAPTVTTHVPDPQREPSVDPDTEPEVRANLGGKATLRCLFHGNPPPKITWKRRHLMIESDVGRYRLLSDGSLEIVSLYRNDSGVYICIADNGLGIARQEVNLQVDDGVEGPAGIAGSLDAVVVGELGQPLSIRCMAYGYPQPSIYWYRGTNGPMVPYSSVQYEARDNVLQIKKLSIDILGKYSCQTYNGIGKPVDWSITVKAYRNNGFENSLFLVSRQNEEVTTSRQPRTQATTTIAPEIEIPLYTVPVTTRIVSERNRLPAGSELSLLCEVDGYPIPEVYWTKDSAPISSDDRITVTETRLTVSRANTSDTGLYGCHAFNAFNSHYSSVQISVEGLYIPPTCKDNPFFANCHLIVRSNFCSHKYYSSFCCKSCVEAGQLDVRSLQLQADNTLYRK